MGKQLIPITIAVLIIGAGALYQGRITDRWIPQNSELLQTFTARLANVPPDFDNWASVETPLEDKEFKATNCTGYISRLYSNNTSSAGVSVYLVVGTARHITIHTPDWCMVGAGWEMESEPQPFNVQVGSDIHEFTTATFSKEDIEGFKRQRIFWSYSDDGNWLGPPWPKTYFAGKPALCKIYLSTDIGAQDQLADSPSIEFAKTFLPILNAKMFAETAEANQVARAN
jgi:hypothetical protein